MRGYSEAGAYGSQSHSHVTMAQLCELQGESCGRLRATGRQRYRSVSHVSAAFGCHWLVLSTHKAVLPASCLPRIVKVSPELASLLSWTATEVKSLPTGQ